MHPFSVLTLGIFVAGYITARWDLVTRLYELVIFAWNYGVVVSVTCKMDGWEGEGIMPKQLEWLANLNQLRL